MSVATRAKMPAWWPHGGFAALLAIVIPLTYLFTASDRLATFGDDSGSYLTLAHYFAGSAGDPLVAQWAPFHSNFPPLLPLLLAWSGGFHDYRIAYALVATFAIAALPLIYRYMALQLGRHDAALAMVALFIAAPSAWIALKGILTESLFLLLTMAALLFHEVRFARRAPTSGDRLMFGALLGLACLTRVLGLTLVAAYVAQTLLACARERRRPLLVEMAPAVLALGLLALWYLLRPTPPSDAYGATLLEVVGIWISQPLRIFVASSDAFVEAWVATFMAQEAVGIIPKVVFALLGVVVLGGAFVRLARNRLDAWYVLASFAIIFPWLFGPENTRRLLYPLLPLLLLAAAEGLGALARRLRWKSFGRGWLFASVAAADLALSLPALGLIAVKAGDHEKVMPRYGYEYRDMVEYYEFIDVRAARDLSALVVSFLGGMETTGHVTPPGSRVMWMRPEYVGLVAHREGVPYLFRWDKRRLAEEVRRSHTDYVVVSWLYKNDLEHANGDPNVDTTPYARPVFSERGFTLMQVDREALERYLGGEAPKR